MAKRVRTLVDYYDDLTGELVPADESGKPTAQTITFAWEGIGYEIDLAPGNAEQLREFMVRITENSRRLDGKRNTKETRRAAPGKSRGGLPAAQQKSLTASQNAAEAAANGEPLTEYQIAMEKRNFLREVRTWARSQGMDQGMNGRIRPEVREAWDREHPDRPVPPETPGEATRRKIRMGDLAAAG